MELASSIGVYGRTVVIEFTLCVGKLEVHMVEWNFVLLC